MRNVALVLLCLMPLLLVLGPAPADISLSLIALLFLASSAMQRKWEWLRAWDVRFLLVFFLYLSAQSWLSSADAPRSAYLSAVWIRFPMFYAAVRYWLLTDMRATKYLAYATAATLCFVMVDSWVQYFTGASIFGAPTNGMRLTGPLSTPNVGNYTLKLMIPTVAVLATIGQWRFAGALLIATALLVPLTGERGVTLLLLLALTSGLIIMFVIAPSLRRYVLMGSVTLCVLVSVAATQNVVQLQIQRSVSMLSQFAESEYGQIYTAALKLWAQNPLLGVGRGQFQAECAALVKAGQLRASNEYQQIGCNIHAHNLYLQLLAETGAVGALIFVFFIIACVRQWWRGRAEVPFPLWVGTVVGALVIFFPFINTQNFFTNWPGALFWFTLAFSMALLKLRRV